MIQRTRSLAVIEATSRDRSASIPEPAAAAGVSVPLPDLSRFDRLLGDSVNQDDSTNEALNMRCHERSSAGQITVARFLGDPRSRDDSSDKALNIQCQDMSAAGRTTVFFA